MEITIVLCFLIHICFKCLLMSLINTVSDTLECMYQRLVDFLWSHLSKIKLQQKMEMGNMRMYQIVDSAVNALKIYKYKIVT